MKSSQTQSEQTQSEQTQFEQATPEQATSEQAEKVASAQREDIKNLKNRVRILEEQIALILEKMVKL